MTEKRRPQLRRKSTDYLVAAQKCSGQQIVFGKTNNRIIVRAFLSFPHERGALVGEMSVLGR